MHLPCTILIRDPIAQISATKSEMPAPVNFNFCLRPSSCSLSFPISVSKGSIGMFSVFSKFPFFAVSGICFPHQSYREVVDSCILFAVIENWDILFSLVKSLFVTDVSIYLETTRQVFLCFILAGILSFRVLGLSLAWFHSLILFGLFQFLR